MSKESFNKFIALVFILASLTVIKGWFSYSYAFLWLGSLVGFYLPNIECLLYAFVAQPNDEISKRIKMCFSLKKRKELFTLCGQIKSEGKSLIVHTAYFQILFIILTFYVLLSSGSHFGRGVVYGFSLSLFFEEVFGYLSKKNLKNWFAGVSPPIDSHKEKVYLYVNGLILLIFSLIL